MVSNLISFIMFAGIGLLTIFLSLAGKLAMDPDKQGITQMIQATAVNISFWVKIQGYTHFGDSRIMNEFPLLQVFSLVKKLLSETIQHASGFTLVVSHGEYGTG